MRRITYSDDLVPMDKLCIEKGITRRELSRLTGIPIRTLEGWAKRSRTNPNVYQLYKVAQALGCTIENLLDPEILKQEAAGDE